MTSASVTVSAAWALRLPVSAAGALAPLRLIAGVEIGEHPAGNEIWLRGRSADEVLAGALRALPAIARYAWLPDGRLQPHGATLAVERLPAVEWQLLRAWLRFAVPLTRLPANTPPAVQITLGPGYDARPANAALVPLAALLDWMLVAPALRLAPLRFAATSAGYSLVLGSPLPALPCRACFEDSGVVVPAGLAWRPTVSALVVRRLLRAPNDAVVVWDETGARVLNAELFVTASRGAARATRALMATDALP